MNKTPLQMLPKASDYAPRPHDPLPLYYYPVIGSLYKRRVEMCLDMLPSGETVLEVGFGSGISFLNLAKKYTHIHGIDLDADCEKCKQTFRDFPLNLHLRNGSVTQMPYEDNTFDAIVLVSILEHLQPNVLQNAFRELERVVKKGGTIVYGVPIERKLMVTAFSILGYNIREHHFSTEKDVLCEAKKYFRLTKIYQLRPFVGLVGAVYEAACLIKK